MELDLSVQADPGVPVRVLVEWPSVDHSVVHQIQGYVIMRRQDGVLLALPGGTVDEENLLHFSVSEDGTDPLVGPYVLFDVPLLVQQPGGELVNSGDLVSVLVVDMSLPGALDMIFPYPTDEEADVDLVNNFAASEAGARPSFPDLLDRTRSWLTVETGDRLGFYSAQEEPTVTPTAKVKAKGGLPDGSTTPAKKAGVPAKTAAPKRATVAGLSAQLETVLTALPVITDQLANLTLRQDAMEKSKKKEVPAPEAPFRAIAASRAAQPVSGLLSGQVNPGLSGLGSVVGPPPPTRLNIPGKMPPAPAKPMPEDEPLDPLQPQDELQAGSPMALALLEQSRALRTLMAHIQSTGSDPMSDLSSTAPTTGVKGTMAREKLQRELSQGTGAFYLKIAQAMQRRMSPTSKPISEISEVKDTSLLEYLERFGGYGQNRELGMIQWSLGHAFDSMAKGEWGSAMDHVALTIMMVEQAAVDNNRWQLAWQLRLLDDPPQNLWLSRGQTATGSRRMFAPMCPQSWTTTALAAMKEAEVLQNKKTEFLGNPKNNQDDPPPSKPAPKRKPGRGKGSQQPPQDQEGKGA